MYSIPYMSVQHLIKHICNSSSGTYKYIDFLQQNHSMTRLSMWQHFSLLYQSNPPCDGGGWNYPLPLPQVAVTMPLPTLNYLYLGVISLKDSDIILYCSV